MPTLDTQKIALLRRRIEEAERNLQMIKQILDHTGDVSDILKKDAEEAEPADGERIVYGLFDGEHMKGEDGETYPVPANYASKSKLVEGDKLKLTIEEDGGFIYKQVGPVERIREKGQYAISDQGQPVVKVDGKEYRIAVASVTFYKIDEGDTVTILLPEKGEPVWGAVENVLKN